MRLSDFSFDLPDELIAQEPAVPRDSARLFVYDRLADTVRHAAVRDLPDLLPPAAVLVANNSRVRNARLHCRLSDRTVELLVLEPVDKNRYRCLVGGRGVAAGDVIEIYRDAERQQPAPLQATVVSREDDPAMATYLVEFSGPEDVEAALAEAGEAPLPPYIRSRRSQPEQYQTIFAKETGSAAAPTAGLHFTPELLERLRGASFDWEEVTLHVGLGTFLPLRKDEVEENRLHLERTYVSPETAGRLGAALAADRPIVAVGTTSTRTLEAHWRDGAIQPGWQATDLFIYPGYVFGPQRGLLTNFHLPKSSLLMLVAAFLANHPQERRLTRTPDEAITLLRRLYDEAIAEGYRFFSFGDAMLIL